MRAPQINQASTTRGGYLQGSGGIMSDLNQRMSDLDLDNNPGIVGSASTAHMRNEY